MNSNENTRPSRLMLFCGSGQLKSTNTDLLVDILAEIGMIGNRVENSDHDFIPGDRFIDHVSFLGCSPNIALTPEESEQYCYVHINTPDSRPRLYSGINTVPPRCSECGQIKNNWQQCEQPGFCEHCSIEDLQTRLMWRRKGALSRWVIEIMHIYPHEAVPSSLLLRSLENVTGVEWRYAYLQA